MFGNKVRDINYWGADKSLSRPGRIQARKHVSDAHDFNNIEMQAVKFFFYFLEGKAPKEIHAILTEISANIRVLSCYSKYTPHAVTHGLSPEDGHKDARNMLRQCQ